MSDCRPLNKHPHSMENYDQGALNDLQQTKTNKKKIQSRIENEKYLREHPEVKLLISDFLKQAFLNKPENGREFAANYFTNPNLKEKVKNLLKENEKNSEVYKIIEKMNTQDLKN